MNSFQNIVLSVAGIILIIFITFIGVFIYRNKNTVAYPPVLAQCPDYWVIDGSGNNTTCSNVKDLGVCPAQSGEKHQIMNFQSPLFSGDSGPCNKYTWAKKCEVSWDGITYGVQNPCQE